MVVVGERGVTQIRLVVTVEVLLSEYFTVNNIGLVRTFGGVVSWAFAKKPLYAGKRVSGQARRVKSPIHQLQMPASRE
jgi:hypothetical protein